MNIDKAKKWLHSYLKLKSYGFVGRFLSPEAKLYKKEKPEPDCDVLTWCVQKALEELGV